MTKRQRITHGVDSFVPNYNEELGTQETSTISSRKPLHFCDQCNYKAIKKGNFFNFFIYKNLDSELLNSKTAITYNLLLLYLEID